MSVLKTDTVTSITANTNLTLNGTGTGGIRIGTGFGVFQQTAYDLGTNASGTETLSAVNGNIQSGINGGTHTIAPQAQLSTIEVQYTNNGSAGTITTSGYTFVTGDTYDLTNGSKYILTSTVTGSSKQLHVSALQDPPVSTISFIGTTIKTTNASTFTFSNHALGDAASNRRVVVTTAHTGGSTATVSAVTIAGTSATKAADSGLDGEFIVTIWYADVATGTTGDIVVAMTGSKGCCGLGVYRVLNGGTLVDTATDKNDNTAMTGTITCTSGNVIIATSIVSDSRTATWSSTVTEQFDGELEGSSYYSGAMGTSNVGDVTVTATWSGGTSFDAFAVAAFGPQERKWNTL